MNQQEKCSPHPRAKRRGSPLALLRRGISRAWQRSTLPARSVAVLKMIVNGLVLTLIMASVVVIDVVATLIHALCRLSGGRSLRDAGHHAP